jgi:catechol 2,3-dioxygenase-like lactoylglutathione lyase family enzyme
MLKRMDHVGVIVTDLGLATAFFEALGFELEGKATVDDRAADRVTGLRDARSDVAMVRVPGNRDGGLELIQYHAPTVVTGDSWAPPNTLGLRHMAFEVDDLKDTVERLGKHGGELVGEIVDYENVYRLCYLRGPEGIIVELVERIS